MRTVHFRPTVGRVSSLNYTDENQRDYEAKKVLYERLSKTYYLDSFSSKYASKSLLEDIESRKSYSPKKEEIVPYLALLNETCWILSYNCRMDVEIYRANRLLKSRNLPPQTQPEYLHLPSEKYFLTIQRFIDHENALGVFMCPAPPRIIHPNTDLVLRR